MFWNKNKLQDELDEAKIELDFYKKYTQGLEEKLNSKEHFEDLMRDSIGLPMIHFANVDETGKPPHFLEGLNEDQRKNFVADIAIMYKDEKFQQIFDYVINLLGNHAIQKADVNEMKNGQMAIVGIRTLRNEFNKLYNEYEASRKPPEEFDPLEVLPNN